MRNKDQTNYNKLVGRIGNEYYFLDYTFDHKTFKGATGSIMRPVTIEEAQYRRDNWDEDGERWKYAVANGRTELGRKEWTEFVLDVDGDDAVFDLSYYCQYGEPLLDRLDPNRETHELVECLGGGRCFRPNMQWESIYSWELWKEIKRYEQMSLVS